MSPGTPRIAPIPPEQWDERLCRMLAIAPGGTVEPMHIFTTLAHQPELFRRWLGFGGALLAGSIPGRLRELIILRTSYRFNGPYEWAHHLELGAAQGITPSELAAVGSELDTVSWDPIERAVLTAVDETADDGSVSDATWSVLRSRFDDGELVELLMLIGHYQMLSSVLRSLRIPLEPLAQSLADAVAGGPPA